MVLVFVSEFEIVVVLVLYCDISMCPWCFCLLWYCYFSVVLVFLVYRWYYSAVSMVNTRLPRLLIRVGCKDDLMLISHTITQGNEGWLCLVTSPLANYLNIGIDKHVTCCLRIH